MIVLLVEPPTSAGTPPAEPLKPHSGSAAPMTSVRSARPFAAPRRRPHQNRRGERKKRPAGIGECSPNAAVTRLAFTLRGSADVLAQS